MWFPIESFELLDPFKLDEGPAWESDTNLGEQYQVFISVQVVF